MANASGKHTPTRCAFVVMKLRIGESAYFLMRGDAKWHDVNFPGGHEDKRDGGSLLRTAHRELREEVSALRCYTQEQLQLVPLTEAVEHGPVWSRSKNRETSYEIAFFLAQFTTRPHALQSATTGMARSVLVAEADMLAPDAARRGISSLAVLLDTAVEGGFEAIPYSWNEDVSALIGDAALQRGKHRQLPLHLWSEDAD